MSMIVSGNNHFSVNCFSQRGQHHVLNNSACEDVYITVNEESFQIYGLADGQSNKRFCAVGGKTVLNSIAEYIKSRSLQELIHHEHLDEVQYELIRVIRNTLSELSTAYCVDATEFSSTIVVVAIDTNTKDYLIIHLGDGSVIGIKKEIGTVMLSAPDNGITRQYTWLTTSTDALKHLRVYRGSIEDLERVVLLTDGATMLCRGQHIVKKAEPIFCDLHDPQKIIDLLKSSTPLDDASCIVVDFNNI